MNYEQPPLPNNIIDLNKARQQRRIDRLANMTTSQLFFHEQQLLTEGNTHDLIEISDELNRRGKE